MMGDGTALMGRLECKVCLIDLHWIIRSNVINHSLASFHINVANINVKDSTHLTGVGVGAFTCLTGDGDCWRPPVTLVTSDG